MKAAVISLGSTSSKWIAKAMKKYFDRVDELNIKEIEVNLNGLDEGLVFYRGKKLSDYDCILPKGSFRYAQLLRAMTTILQKKTYIPFQSRTFTLGHDKLLSQLKFQEDSIPMPKTYVSSDNKSAKEILKKINYPIVMKFPQGTQGKGVMFCDSYSSASSMLDAMGALKQPVVIQDYIEAKGEDIRAIVVGENVVAAMKRTAKEGEKRANVHQGGEGEKIDLSFETKKMAIKAAKAIGAEICGVDLLEDEKGVVVIEVNLSPGLQGITKATKTDVASKIAKYLYDQTKKFHELEIEIKNIKSKKLKKLDDTSVEIDRNLTDSEEIISNIELKNKKIILPEFLTKIVALDNKEEVVIKANRNSFFVRKSSVMGK